MLTRRDSYKQTDAKIALLGSRHVGKSDEKVEDIFLFPATSLGKREVTLLSRKPRAIAVRFLTKRFIGEYDSSQDFTYQFTATIDDDQVNLEILDPGPESTGESSLESRTLWADGLVLVYSITDRKSFEEVRDLHNLLIPFKQKIVAMIVGNKSDLEHERQVSKTEGYSLAEIFKCMFVECSASDGYPKVAEVFHELYREVLKRKKDRRMSLSPRPLRALGKVFRRNSSKNLLLAPGSPSL